MLNLYLYTKDDLRIEKNKLFFIAILLIMNTRCIDLTNYQISSHCSSLLMLIRFLAFFTQNNGIPSIV